MQVKSKSGRVFELPSPQEEAQICNRELDARPAVGLTLLFASFTFSLKRV
jgi:hypothetical protein